MSQAHTQYSSKKINHIVLLMAMEDEARPLIQALNLTPASLADSALPMVLYSHQDADTGTRLSLLVSGKDPRYGAENKGVDNIGTQAATLSAYVAIRDLNADVLISAGTAGGFSYPQGANTSGAKIGTVYLSDNEFVFHDRRVPLAGFDESAIGHYPSVNVRQMAVDLDLPYGVVSSGSSLQKSAEDIAVIERYGAVAKEMEAAAIAWVAWLHKTPFFAIKSITNLLDKPGASEHIFVQNLERSCEALLQQTLRVLAYMEGKSLEDLAG